MCVVCDSQFVTDTPFFKHTAQQHLNGGHPALVPLAEEAVVNIDRGQDFKLRSQSLPEVLPANHHRGETLRSNE